MSGTRRAPANPNIPTLTSSAVPGSLPMLSEAPTGAPMAQALGGLGDRIGALQGRLEQTLGLEAQQRAHEAGAVAGADKPGTKMEDGGVLYRSAFNAAAMESGARQLELQTRTRFAELDREHPTDPAAFSTKAAAFRDGVLESLPAGALRSRYAQMADSLALPHLERVRSAQEKRVQDQSLADFTALQEPRMSAITQAATATATSPQAAGQLSAEQDRMIGDLARLGPKEGFVLDGRRYPPDPSRTGALSLVQMQSQLTHMHRETRQALVWGQWKAGPQTEAWISDFETRELGHGPRLAPWVSEQAAAGKPPASAEALAARVPAAWKPIVVAAARAQNIPPALALSLIGLESGGQAGAVSPAGAVGAGQIMLRTAQQPGFGLPPLAEGDRSDPEKAIPWAMRYLAALRDKLGDLPRAIAAYNAGIGRVIKAEGDGAALPQETRDYLAALLPATGMGQGPSGLPQDEVHAIARGLRADLAGTARQRHEVQQAARADLEIKLRENGAAIAAQGRPVHSLADDELAAAGFDVPRVRAHERAGQYRFQADTEIRAATDPQHVADIATRFAPGTALFAADPQAALGLLREAQARGAQVSHVALAERLADLKTRAEITGTAGAISAEEGRAAGLRPEQVADANRDLVQTAELAQLRVKARAMTGPEGLAAQQKLDFAGAEAAENKARLEAYRAGFAERDRMLASDPAGYAASGSETARTLLDGVAKGEWDKLPTLVSLLDAEQARHGLAADHRQAVPKLLAQALTERVLRMPSNTERLEDLNRMLVGLPDIDTRRQVLDAMGRAGVPDGLRIAASVAPRIGTARAAMLAGELGTDVSKLALTPAFKKELHDNLPGFWSDAGGWFSDTRVGGLRLAQAKATGNAAFAQVGAADWQKFEHAATVRMLPGQAYSGDLAKKVHDDLFGGLAAINTDQVKALVPAGTDGTALANGLRQRLEAAVRAAVPGDSAAAASLRVPLMQGTWTDAGKPDQFVFYPTGSPLPLTVRGQPFVVNLAEAMGTAAAGTVPRDLVREQQRQDLRQSREGARQMRPLEAAP